jgi:APA family basic amino acid/polyamine antiporter
MMGAVIAGLALIGDVRVTWSFSAFTVLVYYAITNLAALYISADNRLFPAWVSAAGLISCASLAFFVEPLYWGVGLGLIAAGLLWHLLARRIRAKG